MIGRPGRARRAAVSALVGLVLAGCADRVAESAAPVAPAPPQPAAPPAAGGVPPGLRLPDEGGRSTIPELTDWTTENGVGQPWLLDACRPTAYPTDARRVGFRTVSRSGPELYEARQLAVYPDPAVAADAVAGFRRALEACRTGGDPAQGRRWQWAVGPVDVGDEGFLAASTTGGPTFAPDGERIAVTRTGPMVFLAYDRGEYATAEIDDGARNVQRVAETFAAGR